MTQFSDDDNYEIPVHAKVHRAKQGDVTHLLIPYANYLIHNDITCQHTYD